MLKTERIGQFIHATRMELVDYWDKCHYSQEERDKFDPFYADEFTEELLEKHEAEVSLRIRRSTGCQCENCTEWLLFLLTL